MKLGILGTGMIVKDVLKIIDQLKVESAYLLATPETVGEAKTLCQAYSLNGFVLDYDQLLNMDIDTIYVALPNHLHYYFSKKALLSNKHVIIEKPITANTFELKELMNIAKDKHLMMLEAMNIHYLPTYQQLKIDLAKIGQPKIVSFNYSQYSSRYNAFKSGQILPAFDYHKAGGALMDINVYNIHGIVGLFGEPKSVHYLANIERGIDTSGILTLDYGNFKAVAIGAKDCASPVVLSIQGNKGMIKIDTPINQLKDYQLHLNNKEISQITTLHHEHRLLPAFKSFVDIIHNLDFNKSEHMLEISYTVAKIMEEARKQERIVFDNDHN